VSDAQAGRTCSVSHDNSLGFVCSCLFYKLGNFAIRTCVAAALNK